MRILSVIPGNHRSRPDVAALFGRYLPRHGIHTDLVAQAPDPTSSLQAEWGGGRAFLSRRTGRRGRDQLLVFRHDLRALWRAFPDTYDAIQIRDKVFAAVFAIWVAKSRRIPVFYWMSFPLSAGYIQFARERGLSLGLTRWLFLMIKGYLGRNLLHRYVLPRCTHVFVQSDRMLDNLVAGGVPRDRMTAVPMGVDLERSLPTRAEMIYDERLQGRRVVAYLGSLERFRKLEFLLEVIQQLTSDFPDVVLLMIGDSTEPDDRVFLERTAATLGISDRVVWTGWLDSADAWRWVKTAEVAVSFIPRGPLYDGASPTKLLEYLALGIPAVANDQPDQQQVLEESGAGLCCEMDHTAVLRAVRRIFSDPELAERMRVAGPRYIAAKREYDGIATSVAGVYRRYIEQPASG